MADKIVISFFFALAIFTTIMAYSHNFHPSYGPALFQTWGLFVVLFYFKYIDRG